MPCCDMLPSMSGAYTSGEAQACKRQCQQRGRLKPPAFKAGKASSQPRGRQHAAKVLKCKNNQASIPHWNSSVCNQGAARRSPPARRPPAPPPPPTPRPTTPHPHPVIALGTCLLVLATGSRAHALAGLQCCAALCGDQPIAGLQAVSAGTRAGCCRRNRGRQSVGEEHIR